MPCGSRLLKNKLKHSRLNTHQERVVAAELREQEQHPRLPMAGQTGLTPNNANTYTDLDGEDLNQEFDNIFLDQTYVIDNENNRPMETDTNPVENTRPPLDTFDEPSPDEDYWDSEDERKLDWTDLLPEKADNKRSKDAEQKEKTAERNKKKKESTHLGILFGIILRSSSSYVMSSFLDTRPCEDSGRQSAMLPSLEIPSDILFEDPNLLTLAVDDFTLTYSEIRTKNGKKLDEVCGNHIEEFNCGQVTSIKLPNPWRTKAHKRIIRHTPISLYCDDTSGNVSKQWNKHVSYYFTLSGLPPAISNQEFNCHFLCTSNTAGALEMGQLIVPEMNNMCRNGYDAYDVSLEEEVLVMTPVFSFLADSPMHAEITSTPVPSAALNPCRFCVLLAPSLSEKVTMKYLTEFLQMSSHGTQCVNKHRYWPQMIEDSKKIWTLAKEKRSKKKSDALLVQLGVRDQLNRHFASKIYQSKKLRNKLKKKKEPIPPHLKLNIPQHIADLEKNDPKDLFNPYWELEGFDGTKHTPVEMLHVFSLGMVKYVFRNFMNSLKPPEKDELVGLWRSFNTDLLNVPLIKPTGLVRYSSSLIGKDFKVIVQAAPFLFFQFMDTPKQNIWHALCHLAPLIYQTHIANMDEYLIELKI
ncbi:hypothetical protein PTTG_08799 [Puccinia triticina 1-1 BBBD Race 1]|uniref:Uncharacterized protein n=1 Tax=Puccinia triticina (isolate 1-1 / race 1 (BBBD)) TaxID=630390 RepID=A0A180GHI3_PUCT1|nr:hypothetical protein PTTG_08799 [Puccinia triticina 1-1 BBBD Race 1]